MGVIGGTNSIATDGLIFNMDPLNEQSWTGPNSSTTYNAVGTHTGSIFNDTSGSYGDNNSFDFDGTDDYINTNDTFLPDFVSAFGWVKGTATSVASWYYNIVVRPDVPYARNPFSLVWNGGAMYAQVRLQSTSDAYNGVNCQTSTISSIANGNWHFVGLTFDGPSLKFYLNGVQAQEKLTSSISVAVNGPLYPQSNINTGIDTKTIKIGANNNVTSFFNGNIGPVHIYNRALSASEVLQNYNALKGRFGL